jgi:hypothetical protein
MARNRNRRQTATLFGAHPLVSEESCDAGSEAFSSGNSENLPFVIE